MIISIFFLIDIAISKQLTGIWVDDFFNDPRFPSHLVLYDSDRSSPVSGMDNRNVSLNSNGHGRPEMVVSCHAQEKMSLQQPVILYQHTSRTVKSTHQVKPLMIILIHFQIHFSSSHQMDPLSDVWMSGRSQGNMWGWIHTFDFYRISYFFIHSFGL